MFGRRLAVVLVKKNKQDAIAEQAANDTTLDDISRSVVETAAGVGLVVALTAGILTGLRVAEHAAKYILR